MKKSALIIAMIALFNSAVVFSAASEATATPSGNDAVAVKVNDTKIMASDVQTELNKRIEVLKKRVPEGQEIPEDYIKQLHLRLTDSLIEQALIDQMAKQAGVEISDKQIMDEITLIAGQQGQSLEDVEKEIADSGMTMADIKGQIRTQMLVTAMVDKKTADLKISDEEVKNFYDENPQYFEKPEQVRASHILIMFEPDASDEDKAKAKEKIAGILKRAKAGEDFAALAKEYTEDPGSKETGGEYTFPRGKMVKVFEDTAFGLEVGRISDIVETEYGYHIIKLSEKIPAGKTPIEEEKEKITSFLENQKKQDTWDQMQAESHDKAKIEYSTEEQALRDEIEKAAAASAAASAAMSSGTIQPATESVD